MNTNQRDSLKLFTVLTRALQSVKARAEADIKMHGFNPTEFAVLELLYSKGDQAVQKIGAKVLIASSSITYVVDKLEKKEMIARKPSPNDRRVTLVSITKKGQAWMDAVFPKHAEALEQVFAPLDPDEKQRLIQQLKEIGLYADKLSKEGVNERI
ncbi:transcriptional regulator, MarR family [Bacillus sp. JCM 19046]|uniref:MarR family 2-MHQ and catechol resistance regulon transcriptional repressor n=1 Tax=Shouchella xiaoxiensis TaxID=766895 RepID=A0ABS2SUM4_9BACI|nr:MarR family transcriptional regulator [Shouchella xiaoxiensis]MBM7838706.1 MarR family 2-MHQ and catechol resistance regulon transcriptional repressor [Shouchella xiaoxiensis]GAF11856.1 transcriptional regulator, MarR family [Bacillus sp. JCM 19045]GAF16149.1 transcriptional regulator, MarR family [Bacillus sp. JCM 19046]